MKKKQLLIAGGAVAALGVVYAVTRSKKTTKKKQQSDAPGSGRPKAKRKPYTQDDWVMKNDPYGYTSFFTPDSEKIVIGDLQAWRNQNNPTGECTWVKGVSEEFGHFSDHLQEAREAAAAALEKRYPEGKWRPYNTSVGTPYVPSEPLSASSPAWQRWLFNRTENLAKVEVCDFVPVT